MVTATVEAKAELVPEGAIKSFPEAMKKYQREDRRDVAIPADAAIGSRSRRGWDRWAPAVIPIAVGVGMAAIKAVYDRMTGDSLSPEQLVSAAHFARQTISSSDSFQAALAVVPVASSSLAMAAKPVIEIARGLRSRVPGNAQIITPEDDAGAASQPSPGICDGADYFSRLRNQNVPCDGVMIEPGDARERALLRRDLPLSVQKRVETVDGNGPAIELQSWASHNGLGFDSGERGVLSADPSLNLTPPEIAEILRNGDKSGTYGVYVLAGVGEDVGNLYYHGPDGSLKIAQMPKVWESASMPNIGVIKDSAGTVSVSALIADPVTRQPRKVVYQEQGQQWVDPQTGEVLYTIKATGGGEATPPPSEVTVAPTSTPDSRPDCVKKPGTYLGIQSGQQLNLYEANGQPVKGNAYLPHGITFQCTGETKTLPDGTQLALLAGYNEWVRFSDLIRVTVVVTPTPEITSAGGCPQIPKDQALPHSPTKLFPRNPRGFDPEMQRLIARSADGRSINMVYYGDVNIVEINEEAGTMKLATGSEPLTVKYDSNTQFAIFGFDRGYASSDLSCFSPGEGAYVVIEDTGPLKDGLRLALVFR